MIDQGGLHHDSTNRYRSKFQTETDVMREAANHTDMVNEAVSVSWHAFRDVALSTTSFWKEVPHRQPSPNSWSVTTTPGACKSKHCATLP